MDFLIHIEGTHGEERANDFDRLTRDLLTGLKTSGYICEDVELERVIQPAPEALTVTEAEPAQVIETRPAESLAATLTVDFGSAAAAELADELDLTDADFEDWEPTGKTGFTKSDVQHIANEKAGE